ncbi:uracil-DNA glycosylase [Thiothrix eikelboomii]|uniref:uracil-DNA glycosylase n=1 Tax=Thiothrix eikelboomii TaxID=92487 RepID=UPI003BAF3BC2
MDWTTRSRYLKAMGIPLWLPKAMDKPLESVPVIEEAPPPSAKPAGVEVTPLRPAVVRSTVDCTSLAWPELQAAVEACKLCELHKTRTQTVFGSGNQQARCMVIGEAPGAEEDRQGLPFVGKSGQLLTNMLAAIQIARTEIYIANILKCRPPNNRDPKPEEAAYCRAYLERQIALIQPALILVVGRIAAHHLLQTTTPLGRLRGSVHTLPQTKLPVIVTYHPAYLLRQPTEKRRAWQDLQLARDFLGSLRATH